MLFRLSVAGSDAHGGPLGDAVYGTQLRPDAILNVPSDGTPHVDYTEQPSTHLWRRHHLFVGLADADCDVVELRPAGERPDDLAAHRTGLVHWAGPPGGGPRERHRRAGTAELDPDGVIGKPNYVWDVASGTAQLGRFGWKANQPSVAQQTAGALDGDIGITSSLFPDKTCTATMTACNASARAGGRPDISDSELAALVLYL